MAAELILAPEAKVDIAEAYAWYEASRFGLGEDFLNAVDACMESIRRQPDMFTSVGPGSRRALARRFPYAIFFDVVDNTVTVYAILHTSRNPSRWRQRIPT